MSDSESEMIDDLMSVTMSDSESEMIDDTATPSETADTLQMQLGLPFAGFYQTIHCDRPYDLNTAFMDYMFEGNWYDDLTRESMPKDLVQFF